MSLNMPAVMVLDRVGPLALHARRCRMPARHLAFPTRDDDAKPAGGAGRPRHLAVPTSPCSMPASPKAAGAGRCASSPDTPDAPNASAVRPGRRLVSARHSGRRGAARWLGDGAGASRAAHHRLQDRHLLRLPRRVVGGFLQRLHRGRVGRPRRRHAARRTKSGREAAAPILLKMFGLLPPDTRPSPPRPQARSW